MTVAQKARLKAENIKPKIGARVLNSKQELLSGELADEINDLLEQRGVLVFPEVSFTEEEQMAFTNTLGKLANEVTGAEIYNISADPKKNPRAEYLKGASFWHFDGSVNPVPIRGSLLTSKVLPSWGGNTEFCNTYAAFEDLPEEEKKSLETLKAVHGAWPSVFYYDPEPAQEKLEHLVSMGQRDLPLVWKHQSGRKSLVLGNTAHHVIGMDPTESVLLLNRLREWATSEPYHYAHEWKIGDTVMWDNTGTMHRARPFDPESGRLLHRTILQGGEPIV
jgi:alpha-ketoglutarate-dependent taurine dioxygenase